MLLLQAKHVAADYLLQSSYMVLNKGTYGHRAGLLHAGLHAILTLGVLALAGVSAGLLALIALSEGVLHYHIDWGKEAVTRRFRLGPDKIGFWYLHGLDQALHQATYVAIIWWIAA